MPLVNLVDLATGVDGDFSFFITSEFEGLTMMYQFRGRTVPLIQVQVAVHQLESATSDSYES